MWTVYLINTWLVIGILSVKGKLTLILTVEILLVSRKSKEFIAFWIDNQCYSNTAREDYVNELKKYILVDDFGSCFNHACDEECFAEKSHKYFFFLAFENNFCPDYVSNPFWMALRHPIVPVVLGGSDYSKIAPENSFIDVKQFKNAQDLGSHLNFVAKNEVTFKSIEFQSTLIISTIYS